MGCGASSAAAHDGMSDDDDQSYSASISRRSSARRVGARGTGARVRHVIESSEDDFAPMGVTPPVYNPVTLGTPVSQASTRIEWSPFDSSGLHGSGLQAAQPAPYTSVIHLSSGKLKEGVFSLTRDNSPPLDNVPAKGDKGASADLPSSSPYPTPSVLAHAAHSPPDTQLLRDMGSMASSCDAVSPRPIFVVESLMG